MSGDTVTDRNAQYDREAVEVMERTLGRNSNCVDVGAYHGTFLREMLRLAPEGTHFAFEPVPESYRVLAAEYSALPNVRLFETALSDGTGVVPFQYVVSNPTYSGLRRRRYDRSEEEIREISVKTDLLDHLIPPGMTIDFIKIDVEGGELAVLRGARGTIGRSRPVIVFEHGFGAADKYGTTPEAVHDLLAGECGMRISLMADWLGHTPALTRQSFADAFYTGGHFYFMAHP
jgi:FkbM family methyltransferase